MSDGHHISALTYIVISLADGERLHNKTGLLALVNHHGHSSVGGGRCRVGSVQGRW